MKATAISLLGLLVLSVACAKAPETASTATASAAAPRATAPIYRFEAKDIDGKRVGLDRYAGKVLLVVNVASHCGFTPQYEGLEKLYEKHSGEGLEILGFPCDQFGNQEPGTESEIKTFCMTRYAVKFPLFSKIEVNGPNADPLYKYLRSEQKGSFAREGNERLYGHVEKTQPELLGTDAIKWNFTKFLVDRHGKVLRRFESAETPEAIEGAVVEALAAKG